MISLEISKERVQELLEEAFLDNPFDLPDWDDAKRFAYVHGLWAFFMAADSLQSDNFDSTEYQDVLEMLSDANGRSLEQTLEEEKTLTIQPKA